MWHRNLTKSGWNRGEIIDPDYLELLRIVLSLDFEEGLWRMVVGYFSFFFGKYLVGFGWNETCGYLFFFFVCGIVAFFLKYGAISWSRSLEDRVFRWIWSNETKVVGCFILELNCSPCFLEKWGYYTVRGLLSFFFLSSFFPNNVTLKIKSIYREISFREKWNKNLRKQRRKDNASKMKFII